MDNRQTSFMVFNIKDQGNDISVDPILAKLPDDNVLYLIGKDLEYLYELDIKNFSFNIFEEDLDKLNDNEMEYFWKKFFIPWFERLESYLDLNIEYFNFQLSTTHEKRFLVKKFTHFIMLFLPYIILKDLLSNTEIETKNQALNFINQLAERNPKILRDDIRKVFQKHISKMENIVESLEVMSETSKKGELEYSLELLKTQLNRQKQYIYIFIEILDNSSIEGIEKLFTEYINNDFENLI